MQEQPPPKVNSLAVIGRKIVTYELMTAPIWIIAMVVYGVPLIYFLLVGGFCALSAMTGMMLIKLSGGGDDAKG
jgi:hypothetical protein